MPLPRPCGQAQYCTIAFRDGRIVRDVIKEWRPKEGYMVLCKTYRKWTMLHDCQSIFMDDCLLDSPGIDILALARKEGWDEDYWLSQVDRNT